MVRNYSSVCSSLKVRRKWRPRRIRHRRCILSFQKSFTWERRSKVLQDHRHGCCQDSSPLWSTRVCHLLQSRISSLESSHSKNYSTDLQEVVSFYGNHFNESELSIQLQLFGTHFARKSQPNKITLQEVLKFLQSLSVWQRAFSGRCALLLG